MSVERFITIYEKTGNDIPVDKINLKSFNLKSAQRLFSVEKSNPMYDVYKIEKQHVDHFLKLGIDLDFEKFDYYLECHQLNP